MKVRSSSRNSEPAPDLPDPDLGPIERKIVQLRAVIDDHSRLATPRSALTRKPPPPINGLCY